MSDCIDGAASASGGASAPASAADRVSVLVRSMARPSLAPTLASVAAQTHRAIELVVVNATGTSHPALPDLGPDRVVRVVDAGRPLARAQAANLALNAAHGRWLLFLDDDDTLDADHLARLLGALQQHPGSQVAHTGVRLVDAEGREKGSLDEPVDLVRLWSANRLAIHAVLFARELVDAGTRFDEALDVYEDWDFWFQLARKARFVHLPGVSATYRLVGNSGASEAHDESTSQRLRRPFYRKWLPQLSADGLETLMSSVEHVRGDRDDALARLHEARQALQRAGHDVAQARDDEGRARAARDVALKRQADAQQREQQAWSTLQAVQAHLQQSFRSYAELEAGYLAVVGSRSWRLTAPLRWLRGLVPGPSPVDWPHRIWRSLPLSNAQRLALRDRVLSARWGQPLARRLAPQLVAASAGQRPAAPPSDKERVRADAEAALSRFLQDGTRIDLRCTAEVPDVSVIVVLFNQAGLSRLCLESLTASRGVSFETLIVDNGSTDRVPQLLQQVDGATLLRPGENLGFLLAVNQAAQRARGRHLVLLNNDAMLEPHTLDHAVSRLDSDTSIGAVGGPILLWDGRLQEAGSIIWRDGSCQGYGRGEDPDQPEFAFRRDVDYCSGAFLMLRRALFESLGGLDTAFVPAYYEESDLCVRLWEAGHRVVYDPQVRIRHFEFASEVSSGWAIELQRKHQALFVQRHPDFLAQRPQPSAQAVVHARWRVPAQGRRVLVIDDRVPLPWLGQGYPRAAGLVRALVEAGHAVTLYPLQFPNDDWTDVRSALPDTVEVMLGHGLQRLHTWLQARRGLYDVVVVSRPHNMEVLKGLLRKTPDLLEGARCVYDAEAMFSLRDIARAALDGKTLSPQDQQACIRAELALADGADAVLAVSEQEARHYRAAGHAQVLVLGHEVEAAPDTPGYEARADFLFVGAMTADDTPNSDSMRWFVGQVWPLIREQLGAGVRLHLVGASEAPSVRALAQADVILRGRVDNLNGVLDGARVFVVPTRYAAGIPHKAHEAAARGLPMVVTRLIADQLGWTDFLAVADAPDAFARHCVALYRDAQAWHRQREAVLAAVQRDCAPATFRAAIARLMERTAPPG